MYTVSGGVVTERFPDQWLMVTPISVETVPFVHAWPRAKALQISTVGCNLSCPGCVSEVLVRDPALMGAGLTPRDPESVIRKAGEEQCQGIIFCLNEPAVSVPSFLRVARMARERGLFVGCSTNGYLSDSTLDLLVPVLDMVNVGLKGRDPRYLRSCGVTDPRRAMETISRFLAAGVHVEVALMHATGRDEETISQAREVIALSDRIPIQVMRCMAFGDLGADDEPSIPESERVCREIRSFAPHVYLFNAPGSGYLSSLCPVCGGVISIREVYGPMGCRPLSFREGGICTCGYRLPITGTVQAERYEEEGMSGGYRPTKALEFIQGIVSCFGVEDRSSAAGLWRSFMAGGGIGKIHDRIQKTGTYYGMIREVASLVDRNEKGERLVSVLEEMTARVVSAVAGAPRPRVYYSMGYPVFAVNPARFENHLVELAGGEPVNRLIGRSGKPGVTLSAEEFIALRPDWICISGFFSLPREASIAYCEDHALTAPAVARGQVLEMPPSWDFGSPRWALGLMLLAMTLHPDRCSWDIHDEADRFYREFYGVPADQIMPTRSFIRASAHAARKA